MTQGRPFAHLCHRHAGCRGNTHGLIPNIAAANLICDEVIGCGKVELRKNRQGILIIIEKPVIEGDDCNLPDLLAFDIGHSVSQREALIAEPFQPRHLAAELVRMNPKAAKRDLLVRQRCNLVIKKNGDRHLSHFDLEEKPRTRIR
ncbi:hypothetical protein D3C80_1049320 [compost metagenome]